ncbi:alcohol oxidase [Trametes elegans]|nr:alcohol oxidase [Trametes elegans]
MRSCGRPIALCVLAITGLVNARDRNDATYDYIVVGGGTAGLVVAARLTEDPTTTVAVVEAGIHHVNEPLVDTPVPQPALNNATTLQARGKMLGGSSGLNFMAWNRASTKEYDAWEQLGAIGWNWASLLPYFRKSEAISPPPVPQGIFPGAVEVSEAVFDASHGRFGPLQPSFNVLYSNLTSPFVQTLNSLGIPTNSNPYDGNATGIYNTARSIDRAKDLGHRSYAASTYYNISATRPNLQVFSSTQATKILFQSVNHQSLSALGVNTVAIGPTGFNGTLLARREVILSAGALQTPHLLELSGIGNSEILTDLGIKTLIDLPGVGENLQDQSIVQQDFTLTAGWWTFDELRNNATFLDEQEQEYAVNHTGAFAEAESAQAYPPITAVASSDVVQSIRQHAATLAAASGISPLTKAQYLMQSKWLHDDAISDLEFILNPTGNVTALPPIPGVSYVTLGAGIMHPFSRGTVHLNSTDPLAPPVIDPQYLSNAVDFESMLEAVRFAQKIAASPPFASAIVAPHDPPANATDESGLLAYVRAATSPFWHPAGTAAMVPRSLGGVVDPSTLKVYGTSNLRVVDASVIPLLVASHLQTAVYAVAEKASDIIKGVA